ncbi:hypothetical protein CWI37_0479p0020 [Hamiltosporidium tvaerminnensis]|uniref:Uncharacterized protein n=1 Tax=Hamiltosporidium tvaerminnensis TaxID=1176355 RepID=A0A4V2JV26_9MICR|nr:hypothetical protein CWI37_0479p0020 [Hamiltosporidium tvaerminnensis]
MLKYKVKIQLRRYCYLIHCIKFIFLEVIVCASSHDSGVITFGLIDRDWSCKYPEDVDYKTVKYWLVSTENGTSKLCTGDHCVKTIPIRESTAYQYVFSCTKNATFYNHEPLHSYEVIYLNRWNVKFRVLNNLLNNSKPEPFIFESYLKIYYQDFYIIDCYLNPRIDLNFHNLPYKLFYKILAVLTSLDPISSKYLNQVYSNLLKNGLMGFESKKILADPKNYKMKYLNSKKHIFMYFFSVLYDTIDACLIQQKSLVYIFKRTEDCIDQCFKDIDNIAFIRLKVTIYSLDVISLNFSSFMWSVFNWLLSLINISGLYIDESEIVYYGIKLPVLYHSNAKDVVKNIESNKSMLNCKFFESLCSATLQNISYLRFDNLRLSFYLLSSFLENNKISHFELSFCSFDVADTRTQLSKILEKISKLITLKLRGLILWESDINFILSSIIRYLVLYDCTVVTGTEKAPNYTYRPAYKIYKTLTHLDISFSKLPINFVSALLCSDSLENINFSSFEFSKDDFVSLSLFNFTKKLNYLKIVNLTTNDQLFRFFEGIKSVHTLILSKISNLANLDFFLRLPNFSESVVTLNLSNNFLSVAILNLLGKFNQISCLHLENSLPLNSEELDEMPLFRTLEELDVSHNEFKAIGNNFISRCLKLRKINISNSKFHKGALMCIFTNNLVNNLLHLDLSGTELQHGDFQRVCECKLLQYLAIDFKKDLVSFPYELLMYASFKMYLNFLIFAVEKIEILDFINLVIEFPNLKKFRILCETLYVARDKHLQLSLGSYNAKSFCYIEVLYVNPISDCIIEFLQSTSIFHSISFFNHP